jgi:hypothetical protein
MMWDLTAPTSPVMRRLDFDRFMSARRRAALSAIGERSDEARHLPAVVIAAAG